MKHSRQSLLILLLAATLAPQPSAAQKRVKAKSKTIVDTPVYKQASRPIEERVADLLSRMTIEEKIAQLRCPLGWEMYTKTSDKSVEVSQKFKDIMSKAPIGSFWAVLRADPWTQKTLETGLYPELAAKAINALQKYAVEKTRLGIPILFAEETPHGHMAIGTTVYPTGLSCASTWNADLMHSMGDAMGREVRSQGGNVGYGFPDILHTLDSQNVVQKLRIKVLFSGALVAYGRGLRRRPLAGFGARSGYSSGHAGRGI